MDRVIHAVARDAATIVFVEHDMEIVSRYADRVVAFYSGRIIADGEPQAVLRDPDVRRYVTGGLRNERPGLPLARDRRPGRRDPVDAGAARLLDAASPRAPW